MMTPRLNRRVRGFSLLESLMVVACIAVIATIALPTIGRSRDMYRLTTSRDELLSVLELTRSEAIKRAGNASVELNATGSYTARFLNSEGNQEVQFNYSLPSGINFSFPSGVTAVRIVYTSPGITKVTGFKAGGSGPVEIVLDSITVSGKAGTRTININVVGNIVPTSSDSTGS